ncbi:MAG TPA: hypothetical protein VJU15_00435 [Gemmatimonadales bacterium]|nr:hypothetical protein [Gemmatimonadales bacterium]
MRPVLIFLHLFGQIAWLGGALAAMTIGIAGRREQKEQLGPTVRLQSAIYRSLIAPGALVVVVTGILLTLNLYNQATAVGLSSALMAMQGLGILGALIILIYTLPKSTKLARIDPTGQFAAMFEGLRQKVVMSGMIASTLGILALVAAAFR